MGIAIMSTSSRSIRSKNRSPPPPPASLQAIEAVPADHHEQQSSSSWSTLIPAHVRKRLLTCKEETMFSAQGLMKASSELFSDGSALSLEVERNLFEAFIDDDYEGRLHLITLRSKENNDVVIGIIFWREVPKEEMQEWINFEQLTSLLENQTIESDPNRKNIDNSSREHNKMTADGNNNKKNVDCDDEDLSLVLVRKESLKWLCQGAASSSSSNRSLSISSLPEDGIQKGQEEQFDLSDVTHAWVKIELLAVHKSWWERRIGTLLLACALEGAHRRHQNRAILHVAGGENNVPATRLYRRFGFVSVPEGGIFQKPDKDLFVLGNIGRVLESLSWTDTLGLPSSE